MKNSVVENGTFFPFSISKITARDLRFLENHYTQKECFTLDAERNLRAVQSVCEHLSKAFGVSYSTEICLRSRKARICIFLPLWNLRQAEWALLREARPFLVGVSASPYAFGLKTIFCVKYFGDEADYTEKDLKELHQHYTDKQKSP